MNKQNITKLLLVLTYLYIFTSSTFILVMKVFIGYDYTDGLIKGFNLEYLKFFTSLSNFYNGFVAFIVLFYALKNYKKEYIVIPKILKIFALTAAVGVMVTFIVTVTFLVFVIEDKSYLFSNEILFLHILNPLITGAGYIFLLRSRKILKRYSLFGFIPLVLYSIAYSILVVTGVWDDFYSFTFGGQYWLIVIDLPIVLGVGLLFSFLLVLFNHKFFYAHKNHALILLGGKGKRLGNEIPKQFLTKNDIPLYVYSVYRYSNLLEISDITLVVNEDYLSNVKEDIKKYNLSKVKDVISGGSTRVDSSYNGVAFLHDKYKEKDNVLIADAVRVNTSEDIIFNNILSLSKHKAVLTAIIGEQQEERIDTSHYKDEISYLAQTPQSFKLGYIYYLYQNIDWRSHVDIITDEINLVEINRDDYVVVFGDESNYKITHPEDFKRFINE